VSRTLTEYSFHWRDKVAPISVSGISRIVSRSKSEALYELKKAFRTALYQWKDIVIEKVDEKPWADLPSEVGKEARFWHYRVADPALFQKRSFRTIDIPGHPGRGKFVVGKVKGGKTTSIQKVLIAKSFREDPSEAEIAAKHILDGVGLRSNPNRVRGELGATGFRHSNPAGSALENPEDPEFPLIYGRTNRITMVKTEGKYRGQRFYHDFGEDVCQNGVIEGSVLVLPSGRKVELPLKTVLLRGPKGLWGRYI